MDYVIPLFTNLQCEYILLHRREINSYMSIAIWVGSGDNKLLQT